jgi:hypothetical protein
VVPGSPCTFSYTDADAADEGNWDSIADGCLAALDLAERFAKHVPGLTSLFPQIFDWDGTP